VKKKTEMKNMGLASQGLLCIASLADNIL
jgi:hypothetical protein